MDKEFERKYHQVEDSNWWFKARRDIILQILKRFSIQQEDFILDIGCSSGSLLQELSKNNYKNVIGVDFSQKAVEQCHRKNLQAHFMDAGELEFDNEKFDVLIASDILEHLSNDQKALDSWHKVLKPGGLMILFVPAFMFLWSQHDRVNHHFRRYRQKDLITFLKNRNFNIIKESYWNFILFIPFALLILLYKYFAKQNQEGRLYRINPFINNILFIILKLENFFARYINYPFGLSIMIISRK